MARDFAWRHEGVDALDGDWRAARQAPERVDVHCDERGEEESERREKHHVNNAPPVVVWIKQRGGSKRTAPLNE